MDFKEIQVNPKDYVCASCENHLTSKARLVSKAFKGKSGKAYLFVEVENIDLGIQREVILLTGPHVLCDISCRTCNKVIGWKYIRAVEDSQKYKEGKFVIERNLIKKQEQQYQPQTAHPI